MKARRYQNTQEDVLKSRALALRVVEQLGLGQRGSGASRKPPIKRTPSFLKELENTLKAWIRGADKPTTRQPTRATPAERKLGLAGALAAGLRVDSEPKSQVMRLSYVSPDPQRAATILNAFAQNFIAKPSRH